MLTSYSRCGIIYFDRRRASISTLKMKGMVSDWISCYNGWSAKVGNVEQTGFAEKLNRE
jgi:hypothetical protein